MKLRLKVATKSLNSRMKCNFAWRNVGVVHPLQRPPWGAAETGSGLALMHPAG